MIPRFTIRDLLWATIVIAVVIAWKVDSAAIRTERDGPRSKQKAFLIAEYEQELNQWEAYMRARKFSDGEISLSRPEAPVFEDD